MEVQFSRCSDFSCLQSFLGPVSDRAIGLLHVNIRSICKYWDLFIITVKDAMFILDVLVLTEINVNDISCGEFQMPGYRAYFFTRPIRRGGGIAIYVKDVWCTEKLDIELLHCESLPIRIWNSKWSLVLVACYRPPSDNPAKFIEELKGTLCKIQSIDDICLIGDFNIDTLKPATSIVCDYLNLLAHFGLEVTIVSPTREELLSGRLVASCLDHINVPVE